MKTKIITALLSLLLNTSMSSFAKTHLPTLINFTVKAPAKEITGSCKRALVSIDEIKGLIQANIPVDSFTFQNNFNSTDANDIVRERFRSYYMESSDYPSITFKGNFSSDSLRTANKNGTFPLSINGTLTVHGVSLPISIDAFLYVKDGARILRAAIAVSPRQHRIRIPDYIGSMYFKEVTILVETTLPALK